MRIVLRDVATIKIYEEYDAIHNPLFSLIGVERALLNRPIWMGLCLFFIKVGKMFFN